MSIVTTTKEVTRTVKVTDSVTVTCDGCGFVSPARDPDLGNGTINWTAKDYHHDRITVRREVGHDYPEGGSGEQTAWHICPTCWDEMSQWIAARRGADPTPRDYGW